MAEDSVPVYSNFHSSAVSAGAAATGVDASVDSSMLAKESPDEDGEMGGVVAVCACLMAGLSTGRNGEIAAKLRLGSCRSDMCAWRVCNSRELAQWE
jgi:hypothetical protein